MKTMTVDEIYSGLQGAFQQRAGCTDSPSAELSIRFYAVAAQIKALYDQCLWLKNQCFPQTAGGEYLEHHATLRGLERKNATAAAGTLRFLVSLPREVDLTIPGGTVCMTAGQVEFVTLADAVLAAGETWVDAAAKAVVPGTSGNVLTGTVLAMSKAPVGIESCTNPTPFTGGTDEESDEDLRQRVLAAYQIPVTGGNEAYYRQEALKFDEVAAATVVTNREAGTVSVIIAGQNGLPSTGLIAEVQAHLDQQRELGAAVTVGEPSAFYIRLQVALELEDGYTLEDVTDPVTRVVNGFFTGKLLGKGLQRNRLGAAILGVEGVADYQFLYPTEDFSPDPIQLIGLDGLELSLKEES